MIPVSDHLHDREYGLWISTDPTAPLRKWWFQETKLAVSALSAVHAFVYENYPGAQLVGRHVNPYQTSNGLWIQARY